MERMKQNYEDLINKVGELSDKNRVAKEEIERLNSKIEEIQDFQKANVEKIHYYKKLKPLMEKEPLFKAFLIAEKVGGISLEDLQKALASPIVVVKKHVKQLEDVDLIEINEQGKIMVKQIEED